MFRVLCHLEKFLQSSFAFYFGKIPLENKCSLVKQNKRSKKYYTSSSSFVYIVAKLLFQRLSIKCSGIYSRKNFTSVYDNEIRSFLGDFTAFGRLLTIFSMIRMDPLRISYSLLMLKSKLEGFQMRVEN